MSNWKQIFDDLGVDYRINDDGSVIVNSMLNLSGTNITSLPDNLTATRWVNLMDTRIAHLPNNLDVKVWLNIMGTGITHIPESLKVGTEFYFDPDKMDNVIYAHNCGEEKRTISVCWINDQINLVSNCFSGTLDEFLHSMDKMEMGLEGQEHKTIAIVCAAAFEDKHLANQKSLGRK